MNPTEQAFKDELLQLLKKYDVEISIGEDNYGHPTGIHFFAYTKWVEDHSTGRLRNVIVQECIDFNMGTWINGDC